MSGPEDWGPADFRAVDWITADLPAMRAVVRSEHPDWTGPAVAAEAIRRLG